MAIRAQPVKSVFQRMPRLVRELAAMTGKAVRLVTRRGRHRSRQDGHRTTDRSADAHDPQRHRPRARKAGSARRCRQARGRRRSAFGRASLRPHRHRGHRRWRRHQTARASNSSPPRRASSPPMRLLSDEEIDNLIFLPGFSTASTVSDISGRGVGMDVVKRSIQASRRPDIDRLASWPRLDLHHEPASDARRARRNGRQRGAADIDRAAYGNRRDVAAQGLRSSRHGRQGAGNFHPQQIHAADRYRP